MLEGISWNMFAIVAGTGAGLWYAYVLLKERAGKSGKQLPTAAVKPAGTKRTWGVVSENTSPSAALEGGDDSEKETLDNRHFQALEGLADDLQQIIQEHPTGEGKEVLLAKLRQEIARYPELSKAAFKGAITNMIMRSALADTEIEISRAEAEQLWSDL